MTERRLFASKTTTAMPPLYAPVASRFFVLGLIILTAVGIISYLAIARLREDAAAVIHSHDVITNLAGIEGEMAKASSARRGFVIARDSSFISQFQSARGHTLDLLDNLDSLTQDTPAQREHAVDLRRATLDRLGLMQASMNAVSRGGDAKELLPTDVSALTLRSTLNELVTEERRLLVERENRAEATQLAADFTISGGFALAFALFYFASRRSARTAMERGEANRLLAERAVELDVANRQLEELLLATSLRLDEPLREIEGSGTAPTDAALGLRCIVDDLGTYARLANYETARERVPLTRAVAAVLAAQQSAIETTNASVQVDPDLPAVIGDPTLIEWILTQLVDNALRFASAGTPPQVHISAPLAGDRVRLTVSDRGPGILRDNQARIFHLFERLGHTATPGSGIGLPIAQRAAELMGSRVRVESELGEGSSFTVELPQARGIG